MFELIAVFTGGMVVGGVILQLFGPKIDADVAAIVAAYKTEVAKITANHAAASVAAVKAVAPAA
ncbi:MAG: hypothetical protein B7Z80_24675 [Rhodospirillales bacterium 20-64-7]|nr:MAG: hypothetical protein B7Z80_24675 [Rhodospirillales bacterium 20-64-7]